jgi:hypothetical protein
MNSRERFPVISQIIGIEAIEREKERKLLHTPLIRPLLEGKAKAGPSDHPRSYSIIYTFL